MANPINNHDISGLCRRILRFWAEMRTANSANGHDMLDADKARLSSYMDAVERYLNWVVGAPQLDLPETGGARKYDAGDTPAVEDQEVENEDVRDVLNSFAVCHAEMTFCASSRQPTGISRHDEARLRSYLNKGRQFLTDYINPTEPLDLPESSPGKPEAGVGL